MKRILFTLMMIAALAMVANTAKAANEKTVYAGSTYSYSLTNVVSANAATATVEYSTPAQVTITPGAGTYTVPAATTHAVNFSVAYGASAASGVITVQIADGTSLCSNSIELHITVMPAPVYTLTMSASPATTCQQGTGADDNLADKRGGETNTISYTITPVVENVITGLSYTYVYNYTLPTNAIITTLATADAEFSGTYPNGSITFTDFGVGSGAQTAAAVTIDVTFETVVGQATQTLTATLPNVTLTTNASLTIADGSNAGAGTVIGGAIPGTGSATASVSVLAVPSMGSFN